MKTSHPLPESDYRRCFSCRRKVIFPSDVTLHFEDDMRVDQLAEYLYPKLRNMLVQ